MKTITIEVTDENAWRLARAIWPVKFSYLHPEKILRECRDLFWDEEDGLPAAYHRYEKHIARWLLESAGEDMAAMPVGKYTCDCCRRDIKIVGRKRIINCAGYRLTIYSGLREVPSE